MRNKFKKRNHLDKQEKKEVKAIVRQAIQPINELKYKDLQVWNNTTVNTGGLVARLLSVPAQGNGINNRQGDTVYIKTILIGVVVQGGETNVLLTADFYNNLNLKFFGIKQQNNLATLPTCVNGADTVFDDAVWSGNVQQLAPYGFDLEPKIIHHRQFFPRVTGLDTAVNTTYVKEQTWMKVFTIHFKGQGKRVDFNNSADVVGSFSSYCPCVAVVSDSAVAPNPTITLASRVYFMG